jgi:four helix bundle protein
LDRPKPKTEKIRLNSDELKKRTKEFALRNIRLCASLPRNRVCEVIGRQPLRSATSVGANYPTACKSRSAAEFAAKTGVVEEEADECIYWIELLVESRNVESVKVAGLRTEAMELTAIAAASRKTARRSRAG